MNRYWDERLALALIMAVFLLLLDGEVGDVVTVLLEDEAVVFGDAEARFGS